MADSNELYSYKGQAPQPLPHEIFWVEDWGQTTFRTGVDSFSKEEIEKAGYTGPYSIPNFDEEYQTVDWDSEKLEYVVNNISGDELWSKIRHRRNQLLFDSDWTMAADAPRDLNFREWEMYRQRLRDLPTTFENPQDVIWPISPEGRPDSDFDQPRLDEDVLIWRVRDLEKNVKDLEDAVKILSEKVLSNPTTEGE